MYTYIVHPHHHHHECTLVSKERQDGCFSVRRSVGRRATGKRCRQCGARRREGGRSPFFSNNYHHCPYCHHCPQIHLLVSQNIQISTAIIVIFIIILIVVVLVIMIMMIIVLTCDKGWPVSSSSCLEVDLSRACKKTLQFFRQNFCAFSIPNGRHKRRKRTAQ